MFLVGGDTSLLKRIINMVYHQIAKLIDIPSRTKAGSEPRPEHVAACAFILFQNVDLCLAAEDASFLCHEPMLCGGECVESTEEADKNAAELYELQEQIYVTAEANMLRRFFKAQGGRYDAKSSRERQKARLTWFDMHTEQLVRCFRLP